MRGKVVAIDVKFVGIRITPAYAGKSFHVVFCFVCEWDHPRLCGEKWQTDTSRKTTRGSPPPMRGKDIDVLVLQHIFGITPAYAGKSVQGEKPVCDLRDHPRLCGEKTSVLQVPTLGRGSPPPMRGKVPMISADFSLLRITPAYAGKRQVVQQYYLHEEDHPRLCGEKVSIKKSMHFREGSPPPMRGKVVASAEGTSAQRDHPRLCGEKGRCSCGNAFYQGSPPPMRGKANVPADELRGTRITPAYAGKS